MRASLRNLLLVLSLALWLGTGLPAFGEPQAPRVNAELHARVEAALARQKEALSGALQRLLPQRPGVRDLYFIGFAGWGDQGVFRKEVERVRALFDSRFGTEGRSLILVNSPDTIEQHPLATPANLLAALRWIGKQFDPAQDALFLFLTSHGEPGKGLAARMNGRDFGAITPTRLATALSAAGIGRRVVVVSSCFSGQFIPAIKSDDSLVITASAADRTSFGCSTDAEWTWFGESYFADALPKFGKFVEAFARAREAVAAREAWEKAMPSRPQISIGSRIARVLAELGYY